VTEKRVGVNAIVAFGQINVSANNTMSQKNVSEMVPDISQGSVATRVLWVL